MIRRLAPVLALAALFATPAPAQPALANRREIAGVSVFGDLRDPAAFYYAPGPLELAQRADGGPDFTLFLARYTGSGATLDSGAFFIRSQLRTRVRMRGPFARELEVVQRELAAAAPGTRPTLAPLPIARVEASLVYAPIGGEPGPEKTVPGGIVEPLETEPRASFWQEREFSLALEPRDAELLWSRLPTGALLLSIAYSFIALDGSDAARAAAGGPLETGEDEPLPVAVRSDAIPVRIDGARYPDRFKRLDVDATLPPHYAGLLVYCFDFKAPSDGAPVEKSVEIEARSLDGRSVQTNVHFQRRTPDVFARNVRFPFAVSFAEPYRYRIREVAASGEVTESAWQTADDWQSVLDITHYGDRPR